MNERGTRWVRDGDGTDRDHLLVERSVIKDSINGRFMKVVGEPVVGGEDVVKGRGEVLAAELESEREVSRGVMQRGLTGNQAHSP